MTDPVSIVEHRGDIERPAAFDVRASQSPILATDLWIYRFSIATLGALSLLALGGALLLTAMGKDAPQVTVALGSAAVGALAGLLTPTPPRS